MLLVNPRRITCAIRGIFLTLLFSATAGAQDSVETERLLCLVADRVLKDAAFQFVDVRSGLRYTAPDLAPSDTDLKLASPYNDWRYWNGVLGIAMARLGDQLGDSSYAGFPRKNIAFAFDNEPYFERRRTNEDKWGYPFGQHFIMEELDDCGAMGASTIEVFRTDPQVRYRLYIDRAGEHLRTRQSRLQDGTFVRSFPRKWTLWADDLYMGVVFLARQGEVFGEGRCFDDAARQVVNFHKYLFDEARGAHASLLVLGCRTTGGCILGTCERLGFACPGGTAGPFAGRTSATGEIACSPSTAYPGNRALPER